MSGSGDASSPCSCPLSDYSVPDFGRGRCVRSVVTGAYIYYDAGVGFLTALIVCAFFLLIVPCCFALQSSQAAVFSLCCGFVCTSIFLVISAIFLVALKADYFPPPVSDPNKVTSGGSMSAFSTAATIFCILFQLN
jgi:hypothetical protein